MWGALAAGLGAGVASSLIGSSEARKASAAASAEAARIREQALAELSGMSPIQLSELGYTPEDIHYIQGSNPLLYSPVADVQANLVNTDPETRAAQMAALNDITQRSEEGLTAQDRYNFMKNKQSAETAARGEEMAIQENLRQRGMSGSGVEAALRMMAAQGSSDRLANEAALQAAENAKMRLSATQAKGDMASNIRGQDLSQATTNADILNKLAWNNSERARQIANMNIDLKNKYSQDELAEKRRVAGTNVASRNEAQLLNKQQKIANQQANQESIRQTAMARAGALTGGIPDIYAGGAANAANARQTWGTLGNLGTTAAQMYLTSEQADQAAAEKQKDRDLFRSIYGG